MSNHKVLFPLQKKVSLALLLLMAVFVVAAYAILRTVIAPAFDELEIADARANQHRAVAALQADIDNLEAVTADWAPWDDIYYFVSGSNPGFEKSNLDRPTLENLGLDLMAIFGTENRFVWGQVLVDGREIPIDTLDILNPQRPESEGLTLHHSDLDRTSGFIQTTQGTMIISSRPILRSDDSGPIAGAVIKGQFLAATRLQLVRERTGVDLTWSITHSSAGGGGTASFERTSRTIAGHQVLHDIHGTPLLALRTQTKRNISMLGTQTINAATSFLIAAGILVTAFIWSILQRTILQPIKSLTDHIDDIRTSGDLSRQLDMQRSDELGLLGKQFDSMTADVYEARQALLEQSFKAGKADTAAEVMHNIRNAMTPMINGLERLEKALGVAGTLRVSEALEQISSDDCPPDRRQKFLQYIDVSFERIATVNSDARDELAMVTSQGKQIEGIIGDQEKFANVAPVAEELAIEEVIDEASNVIPKDRSQTVQLTLDETLNKIKVKAHRIGLLQVMGNLILNAYESIKRSGAADGQITFEASDESVDDQAMVRVIVRDNGGGFDDETRKHIFQRGFTSKTRGETTGLGLHWCANAVAGMGGRIAAESDGDGLGAEFHVLLPAAQGG